MRMLRDPFEVVDLCQTAGLNVIDAWGGFDKPPLTAAAAKVIVLAERE